MSVEIDSRDNRAMSDEFAFGYVYFKDGRRVAYTYNGVEGDITGGWEAVTSAHVEAAESFLKREGVLK